MRMASSLVAGFAGRRLQRAALPAAGAGPSVDAVSFDDADQQVEEKLPLGGGKRCQHPLVGGTGPGSDPPPQLLPLRREVELARTPVGAVDAPLDEAHGMEPIDDEARIAGVDAHGFRQPALVEPRVDVDADERAVLE